MPIYKIEGKKDGLQKYRVRINYIDASGNAKQIDRVEFGREEARDLERKLNNVLKEKTPAQRMTVQELYNKYTEVKKYEVRETTLKKCSETLTNHVLTTLKYKKLSALTLPVLQQWKTGIEKKNFLSQRKRIFLGIFAQCLITLLNSGIFRQTH